MIQKDHFISKMLKIIINKNMIIILQFLKCNLILIAIPKSFHTNISQCFFFTEFIHENTNSKGDFVLKIRVYRFLIYKSKSE